jgi:hypothetical protein
MTYVAMIRFSPYASHPSASRRDLFHQNAHLLLQKNSLFLPPYAYAKKAAIVNGLRHGLCDGV